MRAVIICGGEIGSIEHARAEIKDGDMIICADRGYLYAECMGIKPDVVLGDFDSYSREKIHCKNIIEYPPEKDYTDSEIAVKYACEHGAGEILFLASTGGRLDHTLANIYLLRTIEKSGVHGSIFDGTSTTFFVSGKIEICGSSGDLLSIIPFSEAGDITTENLGYPLEHAPLTNASMGISNFFTEEKAAVNIGSGSALVIYTPLKYLKNE